MNKSLALSLGVALSVVIAGVAAAAKPTAKPAPVETPTYIDSVGTVIGPAWMVEGMDSVLMRIQGRAFAVEVEPDRVAGYGATWARNKPVYFSSTDCFGAAYLQPTVLTGMSTAAAIQYDNNAQGLVMYASFTTTPEHVSVSSVMSFDYSQQAHRCENLQSAVTTPALAVAERYQINTFKLPFVIK